jgi:predicted  nucleic acid-binding Zn-ribbon protein
MKNLLDENSRLSTLLSQQGSNQHSLEAQVQKLQDEMDLSRKISDQKLEASQVQLAKTTSKIESLENEIEEFQNSVGQDAKDISDEYERLSRLTHPFAKPSGETSDTKFSNLESEARGDPKLPFHQSDDLHAKTRQSLLSQGRSDGAATPASHQMHPMLFR